MVPKKAGPWSKKDKEYIQKNAGKLSPEEIADNIGRNRDAVHDYMSTAGLMKYYPVNGEKGHLQNLRKSKYWETLVKEFTPQELEDFEYHWVNIVKQFRDDILHTEELQIIDAIKLQIMMDRSQVRQREISDQISEMKKKIIEEELKPQPNEKLLERYGRDIAALYAGIEAHSKDHLALLKEKNAALQKLKATREQRIQQIESNKETLIGWIKQLYNNPKLRYDLGETMEKNRLACQAEYKRLSEYHTYADGFVDKPILNHETVSDWIDSTSKDTNKDSEIKEEKEEN